jgi:hypothetical protein
MDYTQLIEQLVTSGEAGILCDDATQAIEALQARVKELESDSDFNFAEYKKSRDFLKMERDEALAKLAALEGQVHVGEVTTHPLGEVKFTAGSNYGADLNAGDKLYLAAGAQPSATVNAVEVVARLLRVHEDRTDSEAIVIAKAMLQVAGAQARPLTNDFVYQVVRSKQPHLGDDSRAWAMQFNECKYWLQAAHKIGGSV